MNFGVKEEKKSYRDKASMDVLKRYMERTGDKREIIRMAVTISASHLTQND